MFLLALLTCSVSDDDASVRGRAWLELVGPGAGVIEAPYTGESDGPSESETWDEAEDKEFDRWYGRESVVVINGQIVDQAEIAARRRAVRREAARNDFLGWLSRTVSEMMRGVKVLGFKISDWVQGVRCDGKRLMSPSPVLAGRCQDGTEGCDDAPPR
ncbi:hypothetical protein WMF38_39100 [Sorangium sp. So ce118]